MNKQEKLAHEFNGRTLLIVLEFVGQMERETYNFVKKGLNGDTAIKIGHNAWKKLYKSSLESLPKNIQLGGDSDVV